MFNVSRSTLVVYTLFTLMTNFAMSAENILIKNANSCAAVLSMVNSSPEFSNDTVRIDFLNLLRSNLRQSVDILMANKDQIWSEIQAERESKPEVYEKGYDYVGAAGSMITSRVEDLVAISDTLKLQPGESFVDVGSGHGTPSIVLGALNQEVEFFGYDISGPKIKGSKQLAKLLEVSNTEFIEADFAAKDFEIRSADYYYFFNPSSEEAIKAVAEKIISANKGKKITIISYFYDDVINNFLEMGYGEESKNYQDIKIFTIEIDVPH